MTIGLRIQETVLPVCMHAPIIIQAAGEAAHFRALSSFDDIPDLCLVRLHWFICLGQAGQRSTLSRTPDNEV